MPLNLKETSSERLERAWRKEQRRKRKLRTGAGTSSSSHSHSHAHGERTKRRAAAEPGTYDAAFSPSEQAWDPQAHLRPPPAEEGDEEADDESRFRAKLLDNLPLDDPDYAQAERAAYVPSRWGRAPGAPVEMEDEGYAEWVRRGMWARTHAAEVAQEGQRLLAREQKEREKRVLRARQLAEERERERRREERRKEREQRALGEAWAAYERGWARLAALGPESAGWADIPWPLFAHPSGPAELTEQGMREFLLSPAHSGGKGARERGREALLRWHPDKFEGRWMGRVRPPERGSVREGVGVVVRFLGPLAGERE
ncbi:hypothetical protein CALCODRAFT_55719 [Calocera cornea HHB12733]|uniref:NF-kappa-B inhibitor-like protein 1 n=1 Tax=Calocera cornea HHB12733 TaxID=1353952 RepID=A0A165DP63_9BASI|nr:hypothetical protein CALCODRAFT_55719 [Calocera cornea HHB12733]